MSALPPADTSRLVKLLGMLGSAHDGERAAAALKAHNLVAERRLTWSDVIPSGSARVGEAAGLPHQRLALDLAGCGFEWNDWEREFLGSIARWSRALSAKQSTQLAELRAVAGAWQACRGDAR
jgi:hypothetical protein